MFIFCPHAMAFCPTLCTLSCTWRPWPCWRFSPCLVFETGSAVLIFPVALLALGDPLDCGRDPFVSRLRAFCLGDPLHVLTFTAWAEGRKDRGGSLIFFQGCRELRRRIHRPLCGFHHFAPGGNWA